MRLFIACFLHRIDFSTAFSTVETRIEPRIHSHNTSPLFAHRRDVLLSFSTVFIASRKPSFAAIDVSGLQVEGGSGPSAIKEQLRAYDGSGTTRVKEAVVAQSSPKGVTPAPPAIGEIGPAATYAYRYAPGISPSLQKLGFGERYRYEDRVVSPTGKGFLRIRFDYPSDWLQLDKMLGGIQYVDQRNGDKLYVLKARLPADSSLATVNKKFFGDALFDPDGTIVKGGIEIDEYKVSKSTVLSDGSESTPHRRLQLKYYSVTGNGLRTERRGLIDAYEISGVAYMLFTGSNAAKFEAGGIERDTVENIVNSFSVELIQ